MAAQTTESIHSRILLFGKAPTLVAPRVIQGLREALGTTEAESAVKVQVDEARREPAPAEVEDSGIGRDRLAGAKPHRDPAALNQQRA